MTGAVSLEDREGRGTTLWQAGREPWELWWERNQDAYLPDRTRLAARLVLTSTEEGGRSRPGRDRRTEDQVHRFLRDVLDPGRGEPDELVAAALLALGRSARELSDVPLLLRRLEDPAANGDASEAAARALGLLRRTQEDRRFDGAALDSLRSRLLTAFDDRTHPERVRASAALSLGLLSDQPYGSGFTRDGRVVIHELWRRLAEAASGGEISAALLTALAMQPPRGVAEEIRSGLHDIVMGRRGAGRAWDEAERAHALDALARLGGPDAVSALLVALQRRDDAPEVRRAAWVGLTAQADLLLPSERLRAARVLLSTLPRARGPLAEGLAHLALGRLLGADLRSGAGVLLEGTGVPAQVLRAARSGNASLRGFGAIACALAIREATTEDRSVLAFRDEVERTLREGLARPANGTARGAFALALGLAGVSGATDPLVRVVEDRAEDPDVRGYAAVALGLIGRRGAEVTRVLHLALAERSSERVRGEAALALALLRAPHASASVVREWRSGGTPAFLRRIGRALATLDDTAVLGALLAAAGDPGRDPGERAVAVEALGAMIDPEPRPGVPRPVSDEGLIR